MNKTKEFELYLGDMNEFVAHYFSDLVFRARRIGRTITRDELAKYLKVDGSLVSHWLNGARSFPEERLNRVLKFCYEQESQLNVLELRASTAKLLESLEKFTGK